MKEILNHIVPHYQQIRQQIHTHPELCYEEMQTARIVITELRRLGWPVQTGIGETGVIATLDTGKPGKTIAFRADMDGLPLIEETNLPYQSNIKGKMHACGHDGHTASLLATANLLMQIKDKLRGKIKLIFQPAEEGGAGAKAMIIDGALDNPKVDVIFAFHNYPGIPLGVISAKTGCTMYGNTNFSIQVIGKGGHAAEPELAINPITVAATLLEPISALSLALSKKDEPIIVSITQFNSGTASNIIPETADLIGTIRSSSAEQSLITQKELLSICENIAQQYSAKINIQFQDIYPSTINSQAETEFLLAQAQQLFGEAKVQIKAKSARASEDFSYFLQEIPGCYFFIGNGDSAFCHSPLYNFNDAIIPIAAELFASLAMQYG